MGRKRYEYNFYLLLTYWFLLLFITIRYWHGLCYFIGEPDPTALFYILNPKEANKKCLQK